MMMKTTDFKINKVVSRVLKSKPVLIPIIIGSSIIGSSSNQNNSNKIVIIDKSKLVFLLLKGGAVHTKTERNSGC